MFEAFIGARRRRSVEVHVVDKGPARLPVVFGFAAGQHDLVLLEASLAPAPAY